MAADKKVYVIGFIVLAVIVMIVVLVATSLKKLASDESKYL
jgi:sensor domain CHASE-containing protein